MTPPEIEALIDAAAEKGARKALEKVGLHDDDAGRDINDLRTLIEGWRETKKNVSRAITQAITVALLSALALGAYMQLGGKK